MLPSMCKFFQNLDIERKLQQLLSREAIARQNINDPFLWCDAVQLGILIAQTGNSFSDFASPSYDNSEILPLIKESHDLQIEHSMRMLQTAGPRLLAVG